MSAAGQASVRVEYEVWAASLENRTRHADDTHAYLSPSTVFLYAHEWRDTPVEVRLRAPAGWRVASGMEADAPGEPGLTVLRAANYDVLADSPIEAGLHDLIRFDVDGVPHEIAVWSGAAPTDPPAPGDFRATDRYRAMPADFASIVRAQRDLFGVLPYSRYVFILHVYPGGRGGTEHLNSTIMQVSPEAFLDGESYTRLLSLTSHEVFHTWNVKRFRPRSMTPYNYQGESDTSLLWLVEGTTSYYEDLVLVRAGLIKPDEFFKALAKMIGDLRARPGARVQSVADSGADAWIKFNRRTADATNSQVSFYDKGALVSLLLDLEIRDRSGGRSSLDDLMRSLDREYGARAGYTEADVRRVLGRLVGSGPDAFDEFFDTAIRGTGELPYESALARVGLTLSRKHEPEKPTLALTVQDAGGLAQVATVAADGPAANAGIVPNDLIVAIDGRRIRADAWDKTIERRAIGDRVRISLFRHDQLREVEVSVTGRAAGAWTLARADDADDHAQAAYEAWLGVPWPDAETDTPPTSDPKSDAPQAESANDPAPAAR